VEFLVRLFDRFGLARKVFWGLLRNLVDSGAVMMWGIIGSRSGFGD